MQTNTYKLKIRKAIQAAKKQNSALTYHGLSEKIGVEPSYLSRFLGNSDVHFSDDLLFRLLSELDLLGGTPQAQPQP